MELTYERAQQLRLVGKMVRFRNTNGEWVVGKVININKKGLEIEEFGRRSSSDGYGFGFFGPTPFFGFPCFVPFVNISFFNFFFF
ncbi:hypothetical protein QE429_003373 [Bacillus sp. SORGH_AS 510]|uniref:hypothetical protein n=1 Tax=Bacillus sp. SORGH_AS_0510 TaxID=3041771 RepID=UPI00278632A8|nr:hypothetical protein [Bacillus sp. SORGH_AS_0510]MDQ1146546.1 hypothetical protein [Bacillus sp. SORGH_AS_0510]